MIPRKEENTSQRPGADTSQLVCLQVGLCKVRACVICVSGVAMLAWLRLLLWVAGVATQGTATGVPTGTRRRERAHGGIRASTLRAFLYDPQHAHVFVEHTQECIVCGGPVNGFRVPSTVDANLPFSRKFRHHIAAGVKRCVGTVG